MTHVLTHDTLARRLRKHLAEHPERQAKWDTCRTSGPWASGPASIVIFCDGLEDVYEAVSPLHVTLRDSQFPDDRSVYRLVYNTPLREVGEEWDTGRKLDDAVWEDIERAIAELGPPRLSKRLAAWVTRQQKEVP